MKRFQGFLLGLCLTSLSLPAPAGGPLVLEGSDGHTPVTYQNPTITINVEGGNLGSISNANADSLLRQAFALWNNVVSTTVNLQIDESKLNFDIDINNFDTYLPSLDGTTFNDNDQLNPLVYDSTGEIIDAYFGVGQSDSTIGFAASILNRGSAYFSEGYAVINGKNLSLSDTEFKLLIAHEIGHFLGLDHSQGNISNQETDFGSPVICSTSLPGQYPLMYPFVCRNTLDLHSDDIIAVSTLYPTADIDNRFGTLQGVFLNSNGKPLPGANLWVENIASGEVYSIVSDYLKQNTGFYKLYLPPGDYTLHANSINTLFNGGSSVGPYALSITDISFQVPHPIGPVTYQNDSGNPVVISITAGQSVTVNFSNQGVATEPVSNNPATGTGNDSLKDVFGASSLWLSASMLLLLGLCRRRDAANRISAAVAETR